MPDYLVELFGNISQNLGVHLPRLVGASLILLVGWLIAHLLARSVKYAVSKTGVGNQLALRFGLAARRGTISAFAGKIAFYLVMIFVLVAFFNTLALPVVSEPLNALLKNVFEFLPRVFCAFLIGFFARVLARAAKEGVKTGIDYFRVDQRLASIGTKSPSAHRGEAKKSDVTIRPSESLPEAAYWLVLFVFLPAILGTLQLEGLLEPIQSMLRKALDFVPNLLGAAFLLGLSYFIGKFVSGIVSDLLPSLGFNAIPTKLGIVSGSLGSKTASEIAGQGVFVLIMLVASMQALPMLGMDLLANHLSDFVELVFQLILGCAIIAIGIYVAKYASRAIIASGIDQPERFAMAAQIAILIFAIATGLQRMGLAPSIVSVAFTSLCGGVCLALAIAFGWGGRDAAKRLIDRYIR